MSKSEDAFERLIFGLARRADDERAILLVAGVFYPGVALALPLLLGWSMSWFVAANIVGASMAFFVLTAWFVVQIQARDRRHLLEWTTDVRHLNAEEFEWLVGEVFRRDGWTVVQTGRQDAADGGIDLDIVKSGRRSLVQCKRWTSYPAGVDVVRGFAGALTREKVPTSNGYVVTLSGYTSQAVEEAAKLGITLWDGRDLLSAVERLRRPEPCPKCGASMLLAQSQHGWWFRCVATGCGGKRDLGRSPARAVELLTTSPEG